ncbi:MAG TPA: SH3 domain-containing protein, partial [Methylomirabilota bacterium]|nr:SH3 domain-containing protein [Methylomirabilota bacterium]
PAAAAPAAPAPEPKEKLAIKTSFANLREGPGNRARIIGVLKQGTRLEVLEERDQWFRVRVEDGREGWVAESVTSAPAR